MRAKAWLVEQGHLDTDGRGRMPLRVLPLLQKAVESGIKFSDWPKGEVVVSKIDDSPTGAVEIKVKRDPSQSHEKIVSEIFIRYDMDTMHAVEKDGTVHNLKQACICGYSLVGHLCDSPQILVKGKRNHQPVEIQRKPVRV